MMPHIPSQPLQVPKRAARSGRGEFADAAARLAAERPLRHARLRQIAALLRASDFAQAEAALTAFLVKKPSDADAIHLMAQLASRLGRREEAASLWLRCLDQEPEFAAARFAYAGLLFRQNDFTAALREFDRLLARDARNPLFREQKANILRILGDAEQSLVIFEQLANENPERAESWIGYGHALRTMGHSDESIAVYRRAIECRPSSGLAWWSLANLKTLRFSEDDVAAMERQLSQSDISPDDRIALQFALGKAREDQRDFETSFEHYAKGNAGLRLRLEYNPGRLASRLSGNKALFTPEFLRSRAAAGSPARDPIFILGQPRSGSTLLEQILSSHSAIEGTAELPYIPDIVGRLEEQGRDYLKLLGQLEPADLRRLGEQYLERAQPHRKLARPLFIDKRPANFWHVGLIHLILPNAKIIDARRNPAACLLSMFKLYFNKPRPHLVELGRSYRDYVELMAHFDRVLPGRIHRVIFEDLIADPASETRKLLDHLELPFEESCLRFYETKRTVLTSSSEQVRRPITGDALDHWRNFEPFLGPLIKSLGSAFTSYPDVPEELR